MAARCACLGTAAGVCQTGQQRALQRTLRWHPAGHPAGAAQPGWGGADRLTPKALGRPRGPARQGWWRADPPGIARDPLAPLGGPRLVIQRGTLAGGAGRVAAGRGTGGRAPSGVPGRGPFTVCGRWARVRAARRGAWQEADGVPIQPCMSGRGGGLRRSRAPGPSGPPLKARSALAVGTAASRAAEESAGRPVCRRRGGAAARPGSPGPQPSALHAPQLLHNRRARSRQIPPPVPWPGASHGSQGGAGSEQ